MDSLHTVLRAIRPETKQDAASGTNADAAPKPEHLTVFREFLAHLERMQRKAAAPQGRPARRKQSAQKNPPKR
jgi:hypothetical protein